MPKPVRKRRRPAPPSTKPEPKPVLAQDPVPEVPPVPELPKTMRVRVLPGAHIGRIDAVIDGRELVGVAVRSGDVAEIAANQAEYLLSIGAVERASDA